MEPVEAASFEEQALKRALCRCVGGECASAELRDRIARAMAAEKDESGTGFRLVPTAAVPTVSPHFGDEQRPTFFMIGGNTAIGLAVAAMFLVVVGVAGFRLANMSHEPVPLALGDAMVIRHDLCCEHEDHQDHTLPKGTIAGLGGILRSQLGHAVLAADLEKEGWRFRGVSKCPVGGVRSAHFLFAKGDETISVFSLPASAANLDNNHRYETVVQNHPVVCFAKEGAIYGFVGYGLHGELKMSDLETLVNRHESDANVALLPAQAALFAQMIHNDPN